MFRKPATKPILRPLPLEPKQPPRDEGKELMDRVLARIDSCDDADLDPWERALKTLRQMAMLQCFGKYRTDRLWSTSPSSGSVSFLHDHLKEDLFARARAALFENAHTRPIDEEAIVPDDNFNILDQA